MTLPDPPRRPLASDTQPLAPPIFPASVWICESPAQADAMLAGHVPGYVYQRDAHPNAQLLAEACAGWHQAPRAAVTGSGMAALAAAWLAHARAGDHVVLSNRLYGKTLVLAGELARLGIEFTLADPCDLAAIAAAHRPTTRLLIVETIANPLLQVADVTGLAEIAHARGARLLVDNTFASPVVCRPLALGADLVMESLTKMMNGHSDVLLGLVCGREEAWERVPAVISSWGFHAGPFECWLAQRGLATMRLRVERACDNALAAARHLQAQPAVERVDYPGLPDHPQHALAARQFGGRFGTIIAFRLRGGRPAADAFIGHARRIPFCPSLGEVVTTLSHPETTSHRGLSAAERAELGITGGTIRLSVGAESAEEVIAALDEGLRGAEG